MKKSIKKKKAMAQAHRSPSHSSCEGGPAANYSSKQEPIPPEAALELEGALSPNRCKDNHHPEETIS